MLTHRFGTTAASSKATAGLPKFVAGTTTNRVSVFRKSSQFPPLLCSYTLSNHPHLQSSQLSSQALSSHRASRFQRLRSLLGPVSHQRLPSRSSTRTFASLAAPKERSTVAAPKESHGFELIEQQYITEYGSTALLYRHKKTGAQLMSVINDDENKTFGVVLRTPVADSKGTPHILEHSVLCGSDKYPIKEPFVELMKGSLNTFLNAFTYPDRTCYPVASTNLQDFYNLVDVYMDAVFHPNCIKDPRIFAQEGWHYEAEGSNGSTELIYKGVVFNEMKGVYSSPDSVNARLTQQSIFPDNTYSQDSGGDPRVIPQLTFEEFKGFYSAYYHPTNARFWFYGDDNAEERLRIVNNYLKDFEARPADSTVKPQKLFTEPKKVVDYYAAGAAAADDDEDDGEGGGGGGADEPKAFVSVNWLLSEEPLDLETELALGFLNFLMLGTDAAPLRRALNESGLGESMIGGGVEDELRQPVFSLGLKGVKEEDVDKVEPLIINALKQLKEEGFSKSATEAAINTIEFSLRENNTGRFPRGLSLMLRSMSAWIYDRDPFQPLKWQDDLEKFKARMDRGEDVFAPLIEKYLLANPHRVTVELKPNAALGAEVEKEEVQELQSAKSAMPPAQLEAVAAAAEELKLRQETPDPPEALSCIPSLSLSDIPREVSTIPTTTTITAQGSTLLNNDLFTNDILYLEVALDMSPIPSTLLPLLPLFCRCLTQMGTATESFVEMTERIGRKTGGVSASPFVSATRGAEDPVGYVMLRGKATAERSGDMLDIMGDILLTAKLDDKDRFKQMTLETKAGLESGIIGSGHSYAGTRLDAQRSVAGSISEMMGGVTYLDFIRSLVQRVDNDWDSVKNDLETIRTALLQQKGTLVNATADEGMLMKVGPHINDFLSSLPSTSPSPSLWKADLLPRGNEALLVPTQVNYVCKAADLYKDAGYELNGSSYVINKLLGTTWIWDRVRVSGGAYGGFCDFDTHSGMFTYLSYRDPNLLKTVDIYDGTVDYLRKLELNNEELTKAIIGTIGDIDAYQLPDGKGKTAFMRYILGVSDEDRQKRRDEVLGTGIKDFRAFAEALEAVKSKGSVVAVTSAEKYELAQQERPGFFSTAKKIL